MMTLLYKARKEITHITVCNVHMLVANRRVWNECPQVKVINAPGYLLWDALEEGTTELELQKLLKRETGFDDESIRQNISAFIERLKDMHYITEEKVNE